ncbi:hypothetical protein [Rhodococcoides fascians]|uniref:hypothetical protein n=1 Tax=Rhodococcoides fascians TaxID=1828 RepID=UPI0007AACE3E|nr:hypothetical protein [Rhodococcus fascians]AMY54754.1 hypothetical protein A3L23_03429 [Rhodococcus fascians D188]
MKTALDWYDETLVDAAHANLNHPFSCPQCLKDVTSARGEVNAAHFRHKDASPGCPDYHPGLGSSFWGGTADSRLELHLAVDGVRWNLYLKLSDLTEKELTLTSVAELRTRQVAILHQNGDISRVNGLSFWPGSGTSTVGVDPANQIRRVYTEGNWPPNSGRWNQEVQQIPKAGAVFGQDLGGDYRKCTASRPLYLGKPAVLVSSSPAGPPESLKPQKLNQQNGFAAWKFVVTNKAVPTARRWLATMDILLTEARDPTVVVTPPTDYRNDETHVIHVDDSPIVSPSTVADVLVAESDGVLAPLRLDLPGQLAQVTGGLGNIRLRTRSGDVVNIERQSPWFDGHFDVPAWSLHKGAQVCRPYCTLEVHSISNLKIAVTQHIPLRFSAVVRYPDQFSSRVSHVGADGLNSWLQNIRADALFLEISAGSFGVLRIIRTSPLIKPLLDEEVHMNEQGLSLDGQCELPPLFIEEQQPSNPVRSLSQSTRGRTAWSSAYRTLRGFSQSPRRDQAGSGSDWQWRILK